jgi:hypothetical protein
MILSAYPILPPIPMDLKMTPPISWGCFLIIPAREGEFLSFLKNSTSGTGPYVQVVKHKK